MNRWQFSAFQVLYNINLNYILHYGILTQTGACGPLGNHESNDRFWAMENTKQCFTEQLWPKRKQGCLGRCSLNPQHSTKWGLSRSSSTNKILLTTRLRSLLITSIASLTSSLSEGRLAFFTITSSAVPLKFDYSCISIIFTSERHIYSIVSYLSNYFPNKSLNYLFWSCSSWHVLADFS